MSTEPARKPGRPRRAALTPERVVDTAAALIDTQGEAALTLSAVAQHLGVRPPSLYNHIGGLDALRAALRLRALESLTEALRDAALGRSGPDAVAELARAHRRWALAHPGLYALTQRSLERSDDPADAAARAAGRALVEVVLAALRAYGLEGDDALHATRAIRSALHGFVLLETTGGFGLELELDASFEVLVAMLVAGLERSG